MKFTNATFTGNSTIVASLRGYTATGGGGSTTFGYINAIGIEVVPEPATWVLLAFSLTTVMVLRRRQA